MSAVTDLLSPDVGMSVAGLADLLGTSTGEVSALLSQAAAQDLAIYDSRTGLWFEGYATRAAPNAQHVITGSWRWYLRNGIWYGPNQTYGENYYHFNSSLGENPNRYSTGFMMPFPEQRIISIDYWMRCTNTLKEKITIRHFRHVKTSGSTEVKNAKLMDDYETEDFASSAYRYHHEMKVESKEVLEKNDLIIPVANIEAAATGTTYYLYTNMVMVLERTK